VREVDTPLVIKHPSPDKSHYPAHDFNAGSHQGWALVRYNYVAQQADELSLVKVNLFQMISTPLVCLLILQSIYIF
jgi:hypothetical protein